MQSAVDASLEGAAPKVAEAILSYLHSQLVPAATADLRYAPFMDGLGGHAPPGTLDALAKELMEAGRAEAQSKAGETYVSEWSTSAAYLAAGQDVVLMRQRLRHGRSTRRWRSPPAWRMRWRRSPKRRPGRCSRRAVNRCRRGCA